VLLERIGAEQEIKSNGLRNRTSHLHQ
jgi:hypothetical protein